MGLAVQFVFEAAKFAGQVMGTQVGYGLVNILDPNTQVDTPVLSVFTQTMAMLIFLQLGVHRWLVRALASSFAYLPAGPRWPPASMTRQLLHAAGGIFLAGVQIAAPALIATLLIDLVLGFLGKASPQLPVLFLGLSVKSMVGLALLALSLKYWPAFRTLLYQRDSWRRTAAATGPLTIMANDDKTEQATPRRRDKAREQGRVARSRELSGGADRLCRVAGGVVDLRW